MSLLPADPLPVCGGVEAGDGTRCLQAESSPSAPPCPAVASFAATFNDMTPAAASLGAMCSSQFSVLDRGVTLRAKEEGIN